MYHDREFGEGAVNRVQVHRSAELVRRERIERVLAVANSVKGDMSIEEWPSPRWWPYESYSSIEFYGGGRWTRAFGGKTEISIHVPSEAVAPIQVTAFTPHGKEVVDEIADELRDEKFTVQLNY